MSAYQTLLEELAAEERLLAKAMGGDDDDDANIAAMADGDQDDDGVSDADDDETDDDDEDEDAPMAKSLTLTLPNGQRVEAYDGTALVKSLQAEVAQLQHDNGEVMEQMGSLIKSLVGTVKQQSRELKSLRKSLLQLGAQGAGRRAKLTIHDRGAEPTGEIDPSDVRDQVMAKAMSAFDHGKITGLELNTIDVALRRGQIPDQSILAKIA